MRRAGSHGGPNATGTNTSSTNANSPAHLWCCARACGAGGGAPAQALLSLYDARRQAFVSERFLVRLDADGFNNYLDKLHTNCVIFTVNIDLFYYFYCLFINHLIFSMNVSGFGKC